MKGRIYISLEGTKDKTVLAEITNGKTQLTHNQYYKTESNFEENIGQLQTVKVIWEEEEYGRNNYLYVDYVEVFDGDRQKSVRFCNGLSRMSADKRYTFNIC